MQELVCKNCGNHFSGKFCNACGEKVYDIKDKKISYLFHEAFHFITHFEGTFFNSFKTILLRPGKLSLDFCNGIRKKYFKPLSFFLMLVILYLLFPLFEGLNMRLHFHAQHDLYGAFAQKKIEAVMAAKNLTFEELSELFHNKGERVSKFLLFIILPFMALVSYMLGFKKRKYYYDHFIYVTENSSFFILWGFLILPVLLIIFIKVLLPAGAEIGDKISGPLIIAGVVLFTFISASRFFKFKILYNIFYTIIYTSLLILFVQYIYKFILFYLSIIQI